MYPNLRNAGGNTSGALHGDTPAGIACGFRKCCAKNFSVCRGRPGFGCYRQLKAGDSTAGIGLEPDRCSRFQAQFPERFPPVIIEGIQMEATQAAGVISQVAEMKLRDKTVKAAVAWQQLRHVSPSYRGSDWRGKSKVNH